MNFTEDISNYILAEFSYLAIEHKLSENIDDDLLKLFTLQRKIIYPYRRTVDISKELQDKINNNYQHSQEILQLKKMIGNGIDVNAHQSKNLLNYHVHDKLVYDWNIYHLHLSFEKLPNQYFTKRTKLVLFVYIDKNRVLFLDTAKHPPHETFADKKLLEIIDNNWNNVLQEIAGVINLTSDLSSKERFDLRKHNINEGIINVNGKMIHSPGFGQASSGHAISEVKKLIDFNRWYKKNEKEIKSYPEQVNNLFMKEYNLSKKPFFKIVFTTDGPQIWDLNTNKCLIKYQEQIVLSQD
ncbi:hypothetical protein [Flavobacterium sp. ACN6]|uniref:hypothetical protein n=1 Tax=Flavobacterium sp. ACN6 TaxID=1920426 RepID=UPI000BB3D363|nr:hypothetical protein [Flavobacterium sp. ACN6]PBJ11516.1 hypothetical protein BSF42_29230 [Flavobacterium sp. ACN6]